MAETMQSLVPIPTTLYVELTTECNLRCKQCHMWRTKKEAHALSTEEKSNVIEQFAALNPSGAVVFTGGETFKDPEELFTLCVACRKHGLRTLTNTNGTYFNEETIMKTMAYGPDIVVLSLDSHEERIHDYVRGVAGTFRAVVRAIDRLTKLRQSGAGPTVYVSSILCDLTLYSAGELVGFARELGADGITFQMLSQTFMLSGNKDHFFDKYWFRNSDRAKTKLRALSDQYSSDDFVLLSREDFYWMEVYIDHPTILPKPICGSHERNVWVDMYGDTQLCAYMREVVGGQTLGNVRNNLLSGMLRSEFAKESRGIMDSCVRTCGMLNCHRKT
jgi:MoaA/NifB/PqqE/SkfB family radical SAM enzyme